MTQPGAIYTVIAAIGVGLIDYFTTGGGANWYWAPVALATIPLVTKYIEVNFTSPTELSRGTVRPPSKTRRWLLG